MIKNGKVEKCKKCGQWNDIYRAYVDKAYNTKNDETEYVFVCKKCKNKTKFPYFGDDEIRTLNVFADILLVLGIVGAVIIWATVGTIEVSYSSMANPIGILSGFVVLFGSLLNWAVMRVICVIAENVIQIRRNSDEALNKEPTKKKE